MAQVTVTTRWDDGYGDGNGYGCGDGYGYG